MVIDHIDGFTSNNDLSNLRLHCPPCDVIRNCLVAGKYITVNESTMAQVEIVRKTREIFENTGVIPHPKRIDPSMNPFGLSVQYLAAKMLKTRWKDLPKGLKRLRGFFINSHPFRITYVSFFHFKWTVSCILCRKVHNDDSTNALSIRRAAEIESHETYRPWITYSEERHGSGQEFLDLWPPSKTLNDRVPWICVDNHRSVYSENESPDLINLNFRWNKICAEGRASLLAVDKLAERFNILPGKWLVFVSSNGVDNLWERIVKSTIAGTLGMSAKVSTRKEEGSSHVICVYNSDYRAMAEVNRVRDELRRLGVDGHITYKPDIYTYCNIYKDNRWGIRASRYYSYPPASFTPKM